MMSRRKSPASEYRFITPRAAGGGGWRRIAGIAAVLTGCMVFEPMFLAGHLNAQKVYTIGSLNTAEQFLDAFLGFKSRMVELGYKEGANVRYSFHNSNGNAEILKSMARKLVDDKVDMIITTSTSGTVAAAKATVGTNIPVIFLSAGNPQRLVSNYGTSKSNLAGISSASLALTAKRFELLRELYPRAKKVAMPVDPKGVNYEAIITEVRQSTPKLGFAVAELPVHSGADVSRVALSINNKTYDGIFMAADSLVGEGIEVLIRQGIKEKLPVVCSLLVNVKRGCLLSYAADYAALGKQGAVLADRIIRGAKPADLPIELPEKIHLAFNQKTALAIGLRIPRELHLRAHEVFE